MLDFEPCTPQPKNKRRRIAKADMTRSAEKAAATKSKTTPAQGHCTRMPCTERGPKWIGMSEARARLSGKATTCPSTGKRFGNRVPVLGLSAPDTVTWLPEISVGTDFSGCEMPALALEKLQIPFRHVFACDIDASCRRLIAHRFKPEKIYNDILTCSSSGRPAVDLYMFCAPCVTFSTEGKGAGDPTLIKASTKYCLAKRPKIIVSENVRAITFKKFAKTMKKFYKALRPYYVLHTRVLNSADFGVRQQRQRWFFVAIRRDCCKTTQKNGKTQSDFHWPRRSQQLAKIESYLDPKTKGETWKRLPDKAGKDNRRRELVKKCIRELQSAGVHPSTPTFVDTGCSLARAHHRTGEMCAMTRTRAATFEYWCTSRGRPLTLSELTRFQGAELEDFGDLRQCDVSRSQFASMLGNSVSLPVVMQVLKSAIAATKFD